MSVHGTYQRILVGYDGSENADRALHTAVQLAKQSSGELRIIVVADVMSLAYVSSGGLYKQFNERARENAENLAAAALDIANHAGLANAFASDEEGQPADLILTMATEYKTDLIVVGRRGMRGLARFLMGSVSTAVINHAKCDVLVVK